jgi:hypothetical protein
MKRFLPILPAMALTLALSPAPATAQSPTPAPPPADAPAEVAPDPKTPPRTVAPEEKPAPKKSKKERDREKKEKRAKEQKTPSGFDPKSFLIKLIFAADEDGDGILSTGEFRQVPLLKELKTERVDSLFAEIDADSNEGLDAAEVGQGFGKITSLAKEGRASLDDEDAGKQAKKVKGLLKN